MQTVTVNASNLTNAVPQIVEAIKAALTAAGQSQFFNAESITSDLNEAFAAAAPYITDGAIIAPVAVGGYRQAAKTDSVAEPRERAHGRGTPVSSVNAVWNARCGRYQNSVTGAFIPFKS